MLKITRASDPITVDQLVVTIYSAPGTGKTSMGFTAESPILLDFDGGAYRAGNRRDAVQVAAWSEVEGITAEDIADYRTVVVDTTGRALDALSADIIRANPKHGRGGALTLPGFGELKVRFAAWVKHLRTFGKDVVLLAHLSEERSGDDVIERLDMQGASKGEVYKVSDAMGRIQMVPGRRFGMLNFNPSDVAFGKNPGQLEPLEIPDYRTTPDFLATVIDQIKARLNEHSAEQKAETDRLEELRVELADLPDVASFNDRMHELADAPRAEKAVVMKVAEARGLVFDREAGEFRVPEPEVEEHE